MGRLLQKSGGRALAVRLQAHPGKRAGGLLGFRVMKVDEGGRGTH
jgi:hypothetical protein